MQHLFSQSVTSDGATDSLPALLFCSVWPMWCVARGYDGPHEAEEGVADFMAKRNNPKAARALAEWSLSNFKWAQLPSLVENYGVARSTLERWHAALKTDDELKALFTDAKNELLKGNWAAQIDETLSEIVSRMRALAKESDSLPDLTGAFEKVADVAIAKEILQREYDTETSGEVQSGYSPQEGETTAANQLN